VIILDQVVGHTNLVANLKRALKKRPHPGQGLLFAGPSGIGKKLIALGWAQGLLCEKDPAPCGKCSSCLRVAKRQHPDLLVTGPGDGATIKVETIRDIQKFISLKSFEGRAKVVIIDEAQTMGAQGANALLKTLEEPPEGSYFILVTSNRASILPTIQSRCQKILFGSLSQDELKKILPDTDDWVLELAQGRIDAAQKISDESFKEIRSNALKVLKEIFVARTFEGFTSMEAFTEDRDTAQFAIQCWGQWIKAAAATALGAKVQVARDEKAVIDSLAEKVSPSRLLKISEKILRLEQDLQSNINKSLAFEKFWLDTRNLANALKDNNVTR
jgi:DNA polymerase III subunit delta'